MGTVAAGIILQHYNFQEADRLLSLYTKDYGKLKLVARGARRISSKLAGNLEPFSEVVITFVHGKRYDTVIFVEVLNSFYLLKSKIDKLFFAWYLTSLVDRITKEHHSDPRIFYLLRDKLIDIEHSVDSQEQYWKITWSFIWQLLFYLGHRPELYSCLICHKKIAAERNYFILSRGGIVCGECQRQNQEGVFISNDVIKLLRLMTTPDHRLIYRINIPRFLALELSSLTIQYLDYYQEGEFSSFSFLLPV